jgi:ribonuclease P protein subunit POP4
MNNITRYNLPLHEIIGLEVKVLEGKAHGYSKIKGRVFDETKNMIFVSSDKNTKLVPKKTCIFCFKLPNGEQVKIKGEKILGTPVERTKKWRKRKDVES